MTVEAMEGMEEVEEAMEEEVASEEEEAEAMEVQAIVEIGAMEVVVATIKRRLWTKLLALKAVTGNDLYCSMIQLCSCQSVIH